MTKPKPSTIGAMNGPWALLLKVILGIVPVATPILAGHIWWVSSKIHQMDAFMSSSERFTQSDGRKMQKEHDEKAAQIEQRLAVQTEILKRIEAKIDKMP